MQHSAAAICCLFVVLLCILIQHYMVGNEPNLKDLFPQYRDRKCGFITCKINRTTRAGNLMFSYAAFYAIAKENDKIPFIPHNGLRLLNGFQLSVPVLHNSSAIFKLENWKKVPHPQTFGFTEDVFNLSCSENYILDGLRFSWRYFLKYEKEIKKEFRFLESIEKQCQRKFENLLSQLSVASGVDYLFIGAHMRRGDYVNPGNILTGFLPADRDYLHRAVNYFENRFSQHNATGRLKILILGDDYDWNLANIPRQNNIIVLRPSNLAYIDMCLLTKFNHTIISTGTFGWWSAFLTVGYVTYMKDQCTPGTPYCASLTDIANYVNPAWTNWIAL